jgi:hypothetical protein
MLLTQAEAYGLIEISGRFQAFKGPQENPLIANLLAKLDRSVQQGLANPAPLKGGDNDKPPQPGTLVGRIAPVYGHGTGKGPCQICNPQPVLPWLEPSKKLRKLSSNLGLKRDIQAPVLLIVNAVYLRDLAYHTWNIAGELDSIHRDRRCPFHVPPRWLRLLLYLWPENPTVMVSPVLSISTVYHERSAFVRTANGSFTGD